MCVSNDGLARDEGKMSDYRSIVIGFYGRDYRFAAICTPQTSGMILALTRDGLKLHYRERDGLWIYLEICFYQEYYDTCVKALTLIAKS